MPIQWGDTGRVVIGTQKTFSVSINPNENLLGTSQTLGTSAPTGGANGDISYTIKASDLPTITPNTYSVQYCAYLIISGTNNSGSSVTLTYNILKNGTSVASNQTQTNVTNANYWTHSHYRWTGINVGDTIEVQTWASASGVTLDYWAVVIYPTKMELTKSFIIENLNISFSTTPLTKGNPSVNSTGNYDLYTDNLNNFLGYTSGSPSFNTFCIALKSNSRGFGIVDRGDRIQGTLTALSATYHPYYQISAYPSSISFREVLR